MNTCYWYAVIRLPAQGKVTTEAWGPGLLDMPLRLIAEGALGGVVSNWTQSAITRTPGEVDQALVWQHEHVVERIMAAVPMLPVRFGTLLAGDERVRTVLADRQQAFLTDLAHVTGCVEMGVRILWEPPAPAPQPEPLPQAEAALASSRPGAQYLFKRLAAEQAKHAVERAGRTQVAEIDQALQALAVDRQITVLATERLLLSGAYLVRHAAVETFRVGVDGLRQAYPNLAFLCSGPWPPYHFVRG